MNRTILALLISLCSSCAVPVPKSAKETAWDEIARLEGEFLYNLNLEQMSPILHQLAVLGWYQYPGDWGPPPEFREWPAMILHLNDAKGKGSWVILFFEGARKYPGTANARAIVVDDGRAILSDERFSCGWRHWEFNGVRKVSIPGCGEGICIASTWEYGPSPMEMTLALAVGHLELIRLEAGGEMIRCDYHHPNHTAGPRHPPASVDEGLASLREGEPSRILSVLCWLSGYHYDGSDPGVLHEDERAAELHRRLKSYPGLREAVNRLSQSDNPWIRQAAKLYKDF